MKVAAGLLLIALSASVEAQTRSAAKSQNKSFHNSKKVGDFLCGLFGMGNDVCEDSYALHVEIPPVDPPSQKDRFRAGAAKIDITPPPGYPMVGTGPTGNFGRGYWTRLYAKAFYFRDRDGQKLALVSCDLLVIPGGLHGEVVSRLTGLNISRDNLVIAATHTHEGPGNFLTAAAFNSYGSPLAGFDRELFYFLAGRIAESVRAAMRDADDHADVEPEIRIKQGVLSQILRNRAVEPFMFDWDRDAVLSEGPAVTCPPDVPYASLCPLYRAVDDSLTAIEIRRSGSVAGELVFFSAHPEVLTYETGLYQADFVGLAMANLEREKGGPAVAAFFNGADGDISVDWNEARRDRIEAARFAKAVSDSVDALPVAGTLDLSSKIQVARREFWVNPSKWSTKAPVVGEGQGSRRRRPQQQRLCGSDNKRCLATEPQFGAATPGGAEDGRTIFFDLGWKPGIRTESIDEQLPGLGTKLPTYDSRLIPTLKPTRCIAPPCFFPDRLPVSLVQLGPLNLAVLPVELTRSMWRRIRVRLEKAGLPLVVPIGPANEYQLYVTTPEEFGLQGYEGAQNIYGAYSGEVYECLLALLVGDLHPPVPKKTSEEELDYRPGKRMCFGPWRLGNAHADPDEGLEHLIVDNAGIPNRFWPRFEWNENGIDDWVAGGRSVEILDASNQRVDDDTSGRFLTVYVNPIWGDGSHRSAAALEGRRDTAQTAAKIEAGCDERHPKERRWCAIWLEPGLDPTQRFHFRVKLAGKHQPVCSAPFSLADIDRTKPPASLPAGSCP